MSHAEEQRPYEGATPAPLEDDNPKLSLLAPASNEARLELSAWHFKRLRPAHLSVVILAFLTVCLTACSPMVPDLVREHQHALPTSSHLPESSWPHSQQHPPYRILSLTGQCVSRSHGGNASSQFACRSLPLPACVDLPALCRYRPALFACQIVVPICLALCLVLFALATLAVRRFAIQCCLIYAAASVALLGLATTIAFIVCLHLLVAELSPSPLSTASSYYSVDTAGARFAYATLCLQLVLSCQLAFLPSGLKAVAKERADLMARLVG